MRRRRGAGHNLDESSSSYFLVLSSYNLLIGLADRGARTWIPSLEHLDAQLTW